MKKMTAGLLVMLLALPVILSADVIRVNQDVATVEEAVFVAEDGDTVLVPLDTNPYAVDPQGKDLTVGTSALEPPDEEPDSTIYGTNSPMPHCPDEP